MGYGGIHSVAHCHCYCWLLLCMEYRAGVQRRKRLLQRNKGNNLHPQWFLFFGSSGHPTVHSCVVARRLPTYQPDRQHQGVRSVGLGGLGRIELDGWVGAMMIFSKLLRFGVQSQPPHLSISFNWLEWGSTPFEAQCHCFLLLLLIFFDIDQVYLSPMLSLDIPSKAKLNPWDYARKLLVKFGQLLRPTSTRDVTAPACAPHHRPSNCRQWHCFPNSKDLLSSHSLDDQYIYQLTSLSTEPAGMCLSAFKQELEKQSDKSYMWSGR